MYHYDQYKVEKVCEVPGCSVKCDRRSEMSHHERILHGLRNYTSFEVYCMRKYRVVEEGKDSYAVLSSSKDHAVADAPGMRMPRKALSTISEGAFRQSASKSKIPREGKLVYIKVLPR